MNGRRAWAGAGLLSLVVATAAAAQSVPPLTGYVSEQWAAEEVNACVPDVGAALSNLRPRGDLLGFRPGATRDVSRLGAHWQGVERLTVGDGRYLVVSRSGNGVAFVVVHLASRNADGQRFRSNRLSAISPADRTPPPPEDRVVAEIPAESGFQHAGGMQAIGSILAVPFETHRRASRVVLYDVSQPEHPVKLHVLDHSDVRSPSDPGQASAVGLARLADGRYLLVIGVHSSKVLDFYLSNTRSLRDPQLRFTRFHTRTGGLVGGFQTVNLVTQCDGALFLVGTHNTSFPPPNLGHDHVHWYRLSNRGESVQIREAGERHLHCRQCNFGAGAGLYLDPARRIYVYGVEHEDRGPSGSVTLEEFRPVPHAHAAAIDDAWVELYDDPNFGGRGLMLDYADRSLVGHEDLNQAQEFGRRASALRWSLPAGWKVRLYERSRPCSGRSVDLTGTGEHSELGTLNFDDRASCALWMRQEAATGTSGRP